MRKLNLTTKALAFTKVILVSVIFCGCGEQNPKDKEVEINIKASWGIDEYIRLIEVDSCEYIVSTRSDAISTIHKQNCKFCAERSKK